MCIFSLFSLVPRVTPANVNGGGGSRSELVITWEVKLPPYHLYVCMNKIVFIYGMALLYARNWEAVLMTGKEKLLSTRNVNGILIVLQNIVD